MKLQPSSPRNQILLLVAIVLIVRLGLAWVFGAEVADLSQYHAMADIVARGENIYETEGLFHYSPLPMFLPVWSLRVAQALHLPFHFVVKWPMILADVGIALVLWWQARKCGLIGLAFTIGLGYALNPVSLLTTVFHGSYSVLPAFFALLAYCLITLDADQRYYRLSALSLGMAIGLRAYPVLFLPFFIRKMNLDWRRKIVYLILAGLPSLLTFIPFMLVNYRAVWRDVFSYSGVADSGWIAAARSYWFLATQNLYLPGTLGLELLAISKWIFLAAYGLFVVYFWWKHQRFSLLSGILGTLLLFLGIYGGISLQYLIWVIPFALLVKSKWAKAYTWMATGNLVFFYLFYFPTILFGNLPIFWPEFNPTVMVFRLIFDLAFIAVCLGWFVQIVRDPPADIMLAKPEAEDAAPAEPVEGANKIPRSSDPTWRWTLAAELALAVYVCLVIALGTRLLRPKFAIMIQPKQDLQVELIRTVEKIDNGFGEFNAPVDLAIDQAGNIYVADWSNRRLQKFAPDGKKIAEWSGDDAGLHPFVEPYSVAIDPDQETVWVLDSANGWIYRLSPNGKLETVIDGAQLGVYNPRGLAVSDFEDVFIADTGAARMLRLNPQGTLIAQWGSYGTRSNQFLGPTAVSLQDNNLLILDVDAERVAHYDLDGKLIGSWKVAKMNPWIATDNRNWVFLSKEETGEIFIYDFGGKLVNVLLPGEDIQSPENLMGLTVTEDGRLYLLGPAKLVEYQVNRK
jgi:sugar lactone lactonase YvrE